MRSVLFAACAAAPFAFAVPASAQVTFQDDTPITWSTSGSNPASVYPLTITVSGLGDTITDVDVSLIGISHTWPNDLDFLLVSPNGTAVLFMSDAGGSIDLVNDNLTFDDDASASLSDFLILSGTYRPTNFGGGDVFPDPAPAGPYASVLAAFNGENPNGVWSLYALDDASSGGGSMLGWALHITAVPAPSAIAPLAGAGLLTLRRRR